MDYERLGRLLPALGATFGAEFTVAEVFAGDVPAVVFVLDGLSRKQLGKLLSRAVDVPIGDLIVSRLGVQSGRTLWRIEQIIAV